VLKSKNNSNDNENNVLVAAAEADAAVTALHVDVIYDEDTDYGKCYSNQSSHSYEGVVAPNSPPTPKVKKKNEKNLLVVDK